MKEIIDKLDFIKIKNFSVKDDVKRMRRQATDWKKRFAKDTSDKGLLYRIYKECLKLNSKKTNDVIKKYIKDLNRHLSEEDKEMAGEHLKRCSASYVTRCLQIKTVRYHYPLIRMAKIQNIDNTNCW